MSQQANSTDSNAIAAEAVPTATAPRCSLQLAHTHITETDADLFFSPADLFDVKYWDRLAAQATTNWKKRFALEQKESLLHKRQIADGADRDPIMDRLAMEILALHAADDVEEFARATTIAEKIRILTNIRCFFHARCYYAEGSPIEEMMSARRNANLIQLLELQLIVLDERVADATSIVYKIKLLDYKGTLIHEGTALAASPEEHQRFANQLTANRIHILELEATALDSQLERAPTNAARVSILTSKYRIMNECFFLAQGDTSGIEWLQQGNNDDAQPDDQFRVTAVTDNMARAERLYQRLCAAREPEEDLDRPWCAAPWFDWAGVATTWTFPSAWSTLVAWCGGSSAEALFGDGSSAGENGTLSSPVQRSELDHHNAPIQPDASTASGLRRRRI